MYIAHEPGARLRDLAASLGITERSAHAIIADLASAGYVTKQKHGRRNRYQIEAHLPLPEPGTREPAISEVLALLLGNTGGRDEPAGLAAASWPGGVDGADADERDLLPGRGQQAGACGAAGDDAAP